MNDNQKGLLKSNKQYSVIAFITIVSVLVVAILLTYTVLRITFSDVAVLDGINKYILVPVIIIALYLFIASLVVLGLFAKLQSTNETNRENLQNSYNEIVSLNETLKKNNDLFRRQYNILRSLSEIYYSVHEINLIDNTFVAYNNNDILTGIIRDRTDGAADMMAEIMNKTIVPSHKEAAFEFTDLHTLSERMKGKKTISHEFLGMNIGWFVASFICVEADDNGYPTQVVFTTKWLNEDKLR